MASRVAIPEKERWTYADYAAFTPPDSSEYEVIRGELTVAPSPKPKHQWVSGALFSLIRAFVMQHDLGQVFCAPLDVVLDAEGSVPENVVQPDLLFIPKARLDIVTDVNVQGAPDLMIEILSDSSHRRDRVQKMNLYGEFSVNHYWIVDPELQTLEAFDLTGDVPQLVAVHSEGDVFKPDLFPGLEIRLGDIWYPEEKA